MCRRSAAPSDLEGGRSPMSYAHSLIGGKAAMSCDSINRTSQGMGTGSPASSSSSRTYTVTPYPMLAPRTSSPEEIARATKELKDEFNTGQLQIHDVIAQGGFGTVYSGTCVSFEYSCIHTDIDKPKCNCSTLSLYPFPSHQL